MDEKTPEEIRAEEDARLAAEDRARLDAEEHAEAAEPQSAAQRLRAFEDEVFGKDAIRINAHIERGVGSHYQDPRKMTHEQRAHHAALERLVKTEQKVADTSAALAKAEVEHEAALKAADQAAEHIDGRPAE